MELIARVSHSPRSLHLRKCLGMDLPTVVSDETVSNQKVEEVFPNFFICVENGSIWANIGIGCNSTTLLGQEKNCLIFWFRRWAFPVILLCDVKFSRHYMHKLASLVWSQNLFCMSTNFESQQSSTPVRVNFVAGLPRVRVTALPAPIRTSPSEKTNARTTMYSNQK